jgi:hypothetical protein
MYASGICMCAQNKRKIKLCGMLFTSHNAYLIGKRTLGALITFDYPWFKEKIIIIKLIKIIVL